MKIVLYFDWGQYRFRSYYEKSLDGNNKNIFLNWEHHIKFDNGILLFDSIISAFNEQKLPGEGVKDIEEVEFIINASWDFRIWDSSLLKRVPVYIKHTNTSAISLTIDSNVQMLEISWWKIKWLLVQNVTVWKLKCNEVLFEWFVKILASTINSDLIFERCNMSEEMWNNISLEIDNSHIWTLVINRTEFFKIISTDTKITSIFPYKITFWAIETKWNQPFLNLTQKHISLSNTISEIKDYYRQLKHSHDEIWNKIEANKFFAKEMEYYEKSLTWKEWDKKLISFIQRISNNYGNSWLRPFFWIFIISFLYTLIFECWSFKCACWWSQDWSCFSDHWLKNVSQFPTELKNAKDWWFFWYAIIMGSLIYQLFVALRRISQR